jgi:hypothetical protein
VVAVPIPASSVASIAPVVASRAKSFAALWFSLAGFAGLSALAVAIGDANHRDRSPAVFVAMCAGALGVSGARCVRRGRRAEAAREVAEAGGDVTFVLAGDRIAAYDRAGSPRPQLSFGVPRAIAAALMTKQLYTSIALAGPAVAALAAQMWRPHAVAAAMVATIAGASAVAAVTVGAAVVFTCFTIIFGALAVSSSFHALRLREIARRAATDPTLAWQLDGHTISSAPSTKMRFEIVPAQRDELLAPAGARVVVHD